jgi:AcrR family transcriptional regulator
MAQAPDGVAERQQDGPPAPAWQWARTEQTRSDLLEAAREVFAEQGYTCAKVTDIAARAGLSVGSIYHHFGGKSELYLALWRRYNLAREDAAARAVARARNAGTDDAAALWAAGAQGILRTTWKRRDLAALFCAGNGPPDFEDMRQNRKGDQSGPGDALLRLSGSSRDPLLAAVLAALLHEGARAVVAAGSHRQAEAAISDILEYSRRLMAVEPAAAPAGG